MRIYTEQAMRIYTAGNENLHRVGNENLHRAGNENIHRVGNENLHRVGNENLHRVGNDFVIFVFLCLLLECIYKRPKKHLKMNKEVRMLLPKKDLIQVE